MINTISTVIARSVLAITLNRFLQIYFCACSAKISKLKRMYRRSYLVPTHFVPTHFVPTPLVLLLLNYWFDPNKSDVIFEIVVFFDKSM